MVVVMRMAVINEVTCIVVAVECIGSAGRGAERCAEIRNVAVAEVVEVRVVVVAEEALRN